MKIKKTGYYYVGKTPIFDHIGFDGILFRLLHNIEPKTNRLFKYNALSEKKMPLHRTDMAVITGKSRPTIWKFINEAIERCVIVKRKRYFYVNPYLIHTADGVYDKVFKLFDAVYEEKRSDIDSIGAIDEQQK